MVLNNRSNEVHFENLFTKERNSFTFCNKIGRKVSFWLNDNKEESWELEPDQEKFIEIEYLYDFFYEFIKFLRFFNRNTFTLADFFDFSEFQAKKKRLSANRLNQIFFCFSLNSQQIFSINLDIINENIIEYSRFQKLKSQIIEKNGLKNVTISSDLLIENKMRYEIALELGTSFSWEVIHLIFINFI